MKRLFSLIIGVTIIIGLAGCGSLGRGASEPNRVENFSVEEHIAKLDEGQSPVPIVKLDGGSYVDVGRMAGQIGFQTRWAEKDRKLLIGDHDVVWSFQADTKTAVKGQRQIEMDAPARKQQESLMVTTQTIETLFKDEAVFQIGETEITIFPVPGYIDPESGHAAEFKDDPLDPSVKPIKKGEGTSDKRKNGATVALQALTGTGSDITEEAKKFMGVPYLFGTEPYEQSKRFDCSSFVQYVFEKFNYSLPRTARAQAGRGTFVQRSELRVGDLMFFYVPGRFKSDEEVGHVAIYLGNQKMIHSSPLPEDGVQISEINKDYWKQTFLYAKRILD